MKWMVVGGEGREGEGVGYELGSCWAAKMWCWMFLVRVGMNLAAIPCSVQNRCATEAGSSP